MKEANLTKDYYISQKRFGNDIKRQKSFVIEKQYIQSLFHKRSLENLKILDIGCSTGEFIKSVFGDGQEIFGIEPSEFASDIASKNGIKIINDISEEDNFDLIIYRGTIQYIPNPFESIMKTHRALKNKGKIIFLATPNTRSLYYLLFKTLPFLEDDLMYWVPSDICLKRTLENFGFINVELKYPYFKTPYSQPLLDLLRFFVKIFTNRGKFAFPGNSISVSAEKNDKPI
tara:strand:+ start:527 stop:1216 length:690 start_codon:yes stop_codon:yes gene_type:complete